MERKNKTYIIKTDLKNTKVKHDIFGEGVIIEQNTPDLDSSYLEVQFKGNQKSFLYPDAFIDNILMCDDKDIKDKVYFDILQLSKTDAELATEKYEKEQKEVQKNIVLKNIRYEDFLIAKSSFGCRAKKHNIKTVTAVVMASKLGEKPQKKGIQAWHCEDCNLYYIDKFEYNSLKRAGWVLQCKNMYEEEYEKLNNGNIYGLNPQSKLKQYGYDVSSDCNMNDKYRQGILVSLIDNNIFSNVEILNFLKWLIESKRNHKNDYNKSISMWENDARFVARYKSEVGDEVWVRCIK